MTRSIAPILVSSAPYTAVPSTLSLPIREPVSLASVTIVGPPAVEERPTGDTTNCSGGGLQDTGGRMSWPGSSVSSRHCVAHHLPDRMSRFLKTSTLAESAAPTLLAATIAQSLIRKANPRHQPFRENNKHRQRQIRSRSARPCFTDLGEDSAVRTDPSNAVLDHA